MVLNVGMPVIPFNQTYQLSISYSITDTSAG